MQRNCHEFIAYENLVGSRGGRGTERGGRHSAAPSSDIAKVLPLVKRGLKVLTEREVAPQLGLLKSTLLQLDSTFSEREYGANSFRDFMEKVAQTGAVTLKQAGRSMLVELHDGDEEVVAAPAAEKPAPTVAPPPPRRVREEVEPAADMEEDESLPQSPMSMQDGIRAVQQAFGPAAASLRWPMYVRQAKQHLRAAIEGFDERKYGFASVVDLLRAAGKEGVLRIERDRQGAVRVFPGANLGGRPTAPVSEGAEPTFDGEPTFDAEPEELTVEAITQPTGAAPVIAEPVDEPPIVDVQPIEEPRQVAAEPEAPKKATRGRRGGTGRAAKATKAKTAKSPRGRKTTRTKAAAAEKV
jgi:hypothetical protein